MNTFSTSTIGLVHSIFLFSHREHSSTGQERQGIDPTMNRRTIVPSEQLNQHHYAAVNPIQPFSYAHQQPTPPKKHIQHDTDVYVDIKEKKEREYYSN